MSLGLINQNIKFYLLNDQCTHSLFCDAVISVSNNTITHCVCTYCSKVSNTPPSGCAAAMTKFVSLFECTQKNTNYKVEVGELLWK